jgi:hypothetical protein
LAEPDASSGGSIVPDLPDIPGEEVVERLGAVGQLDERRVEGDDRPHGKHAVFLQTGGWAKAQEVNERQKGDAPEEPVRRALQAWFCLGDVRPVARVMVHGCTIAVGVGSGQSKCLSNVRVG